MKDFKFKLNSFLVHHIIAGVLLSPCDKITYKNIVGGGVNKTHFLSFDNSTPLNIVVKTDTYFSVKILTVEPDEASKNTNVFSISKYTPDTIPYKFQINLLGNKLYILGGFLC